LTKIMGMDSARDPILDGIHSHGLTHPVFSPSVRPAWVLVVSILCVLRAIFT
jgi:hypothetical protein